jgi:hypothetical protein
VKTKKQDSVVQDPLVVIVAMPVLGMVRIKASTEKELREKIAELRAALDW